MAQTYTRQSTFADGDTITAALFNDEYNQLVNAFTYSSTSASSTGHRHDGTAGQGGNIPKIGDLDFLNKIEVDSTNNRFGFYVEVSSAAVEQIRIQDGAIVPVTDNDIDLGTSSLEFKDLYIDGTANIDTLSVDTSATIVGLTVSGTSTLQGDVYLGNASADTIFVPGLFQANLVPEDDSTWNLGSTTSYWANAYIDAITTTGNVAVGGNLTVTGTTTFNGGTITMGDAASDNVVFGADVNSNIIPNTDNTYDLGSSSQEWKDLYIDGTAYLDAINFNGTAITATAAELNIMDGVTATATEINLLDGVTSTTAELNILDGVTATAAELNILDGVTSTATELNIVDGGTTATSTTLVDADRVVVNDNGTMVQVALTDFETYFESAIDTINGNLTVTGDLTISGDDLTMATNTAGHLLIADGTNFNPTAVGDLSEITSVASDDVLLAVDTSGGGLKKIARSTLVAGLATSSAITNVVEDTTPQLGGDLDVNGNGLVSTSNGNIALTPNGTGVVRIDGNVDIQTGEIVLKNGGSVSNIKLYCESSNAHYTQLQSAAHSAYSGNVTVTLPAATDTLVGKATTDTLTNKTLTSPKINEDVAVTATATELNILDGVTSTTAELNILDGVTSTATELNILDGVTATTAELNILDGVTSTTAELNILDGVTSTASELNILDGVTATTTELNYVDGVTSAIQTQLDAKAPVASPTFTGTITIPTADVNGGNIDGTTIGGSTAAAGSFTTFTSTGIDDNASSTAITIDSSQNVGIGTTTATYDLTVVGASNLSTIGTNDAALRLRADGARTLQFYTDSTERMRINGTGKVGIGVTSPTATLDVNGTLKLDGNYPVGTGNVALGDTALDSVTSSGNYNVAIGRNALTACTSGDSNVAVGNSALSSLTTIAYNTAVGHAALLTTETGAYNTAIGAFSQEDTTTGVRNTAVGYGSLRNNTEGERNTCVGYAALSNNTTGNYNEAFGYTALSTNTTGSYNTGLGYGALYTNTGSQNVAVGYAALYDNTSGIYNSALGYSALENNTDGNYNTAIGSSALFTPTGADHNIALGYAAAYSCSTGGTNVSIGNYAGYTCSTSSYNVFVGYQAGYNNTTGSGHTCVGYLAGNNFSDAGSYGNTCLGYNAETGANTHFNSIVMGYNTAGVGSGYFTFGTGTGNDRVYNQFGANASWTRVSDQRYKKDIQDNTDCGLAFINDLRPVTFKWKAKSEIDNTLPDYDAEKTEAEYASKMYGLIAQEVKQALDKHNITDFGGWHETEDSGIQGVSQEMFIYPLIKAIQELSAKVTALESGG